MSKKPPCLYCGGNCDNDPDNACDAYSGDINGRYNKQYCQNQIAAMLKIMEIAKSAGLICGVWHKAAVEKDYSIEISKETWESIVGDNALDWDWSSMNEQIINAVVDAGKED